MLRRVPRHRERPGQHHEAGDRVDRHRPPHARAWNIAPSTKHPIAYVKLSHDRILPYSDIRSAPRCSSVIASMLGPSVTMAPPAGTPPRDHPQVPRAREQQGGAGREHQSDLQRGPPAEHAVGHVAPERVQHDARHRHRRDHHPISLSLKPLPSRYSARNGKKAAITKPDVTNRPRTAASGRTCGGPRRSRPGVDPGDQAPRVVPVDRREHVVGQAQARDRPPALRRRILDRVRERSSVVSKKRTWIA